MISSGAPASVRARSRQTRVKASAFQQGTSRLASLGGSFELFRMLRLYPMIPAVIVAGGRGDRMGAAAGGLPKPMLSFGGKPILERLIETLAAAGWREVHLSLGYRSETVSSYFGDGARWGVSLRYHVEAAPRGTAGAIAELRPTVGDEMLVIYGDLHVDMDLEKFAAFHAARPEAAASLVLIETDHPLDSDLARLEGEALKSITRAKPGEPHESSALAAVWAVRGPLLDLIPRDRPSDFGRDVFPEALRRGLDLRGYLTTETLADLGTPERLRRAEARLAGRAAGD
jgi:mannose-1-phosphate guanylyltransferase / phosphomannomutase